jgi:hypothetical protein
MRFSGLWRRPLMPLQEQLAAVSADALSPEAWSKFDSVAALAVDVKETDSVLALARKLLSLNPVKPEKKSWIGIFRALRYVEVESGSVLVYENADAIADSKKRFNYDQFLLKMTGGVVPMTLRRPASQGWPILHFVNQAAEASVLEGDVSEAALEALREHASTVCEEVLEKVSEKILEHDPASHIRLAQLLAHPSMNSGEFGSRQLRGVRAGVAVGHRVVNKIPPSWTALIVQGLNELYTKPCGADLLESTRTLVTVVEEQLAAQQWELEEGVEYEYRLEMLVALLRCHRMENSTAEFLAAIDELTACFAFTCTSLRPHVEKLAAMCEQLFDNGDDRTLLASIIQLLRTIVDLRPRERAGNIMDGPTAAAFQQAHKTVINVLAQVGGDSNDVLLSEAYWIIVSHKYHGLSVTPELLHPLMDAMSNRGDGRVFNLADACAFFSGNKLDPQMIASLFRACRVAGDHHRAKTLLQLLKDLVPGYLSHAPAEIVDDLEMLKVLPERHGHMFDDLQEDPPSLPPLPYASSSVGSDATA